MHREREGTGKEEGGDTYRELERTLHPPKEIKMIRAETAE
jgi:hypothetical protein